MLIKAVKAALKHLPHHGFLVTDLKSNLHKIETEYIYVDWLEPMRNSALEKIQHRFPGDAGIICDERVADRLAG